MALEPAQQYRGSHDFKKEAKQNFTLYHDGGAAWGLGKMNFQIKSSSQGHSSWGEWFAPQAGLELGRRQGIGISSQKGIASNQSSNKHYTVVT